MHTTQSKLAAASLAVCAFLSAQNKHPIAYPPAPKSAQSDTYHGVKIADPYRELERADSPATRQWVDRENELTRSILDQIPGREGIHKRLTSLFDYEKFAGFYRKGNRYFYSHNTGLQNQFVVYTMDSLAGTPRELIDPNTYRKDGTAALKATAVSWDGNLFAYAVAQAGSDWVDWHVREVSTGKDRADLIRWSKGGFSWAPDNQGFYYSRFPEPPADQLLTAAALNGKIYFHKLGDPQTSDTLIYERPDHPNWNVYPTVLEGGNYLMLSISGNASGTNFLSYRDLRAPRDKIIDLMWFPDKEYRPIASLGSVLYVETTDGAQRGRVIAVDLGKPARANWKEIVPEQPETLGDVHIANGKILLSYMKDAHSTATLVSIGGKLIGDVKLPGIGTAYWAQNQLADHELFFGYSTFTMPTSIYRLDLATGKTWPVRRAKVSFNSSDYETTQVFFSSKDGTRIPMFVSYRKGLKLDGQNPTILHGYGGFNIAITPGFSPMLVEWLNMGGIDVSVNLRGGSEYGEAWHQAGMRAKKQNVFDDFIAAAENLISMKYTSAPKLAIFGGSNGGLLVGAVLNQRPDLFGAAMPAVGVMDMLRFQEFGYGRMWAAEYGSAENPEDFKVLRAYSPLHNIRRGVQYPATLITTSDHDDRVMPGHSLKYAAALQEAQEGPAPILIRIETRAGHGAGKPTSKQIDESADRLAFLKSALHMSD